MQPSDARNVVFAALGAVLAGAIVGAPFVVPASAEAPDPTALRVCADPNNMPFSNAEGEGFENKLAEMLAADLGKHVTYEWRAQRRGFVRNTLKAEVCDVMMGVPAHYDLVDATRPYYRSTYVFVSRADRNLDIASIKDPRLKNLKIGVHLIGDDGMNTPPAHALSQQGVVTNLVGYSIYGDYRDPDPPARLIEAVERGDIDLAAAWGPFAGYAAKTSQVPLVLVPIADAESFAPLRFQFEIAMGVRKGDAALKTQLDDFIALKQPELRALLQSYGVPLEPLGARAADTGTK
jgi:mxaJ protein